MHCLSITWALLPYTTRRTCSRELLLLPPRSQNEKCGANLSLTDILNRAATVDLSTHEWETEASCKPLRFFWGGCLLCSITTKIALLFVLFSKTLNSHTKNNVFNKILASAVKVTMWKGVCHAQKWKYSSKLLKSGSFLTIPQSFWNREYAYISLYYNLWQFKMKQNTCFQFDLIAKH